MPLTPPGIAGTLAPFFAGFGLTGIGVPQLTLAVGTGVSLWTSSTLVVASTDIGTAGAGFSTTPCVIPVPLLIGGLTTGFAGATLTGISVPQLVSALANGLAAAFATQGVVTLTHAGVGSGVGTAVFAGPSSVPSMLGGFSSSGMTGLAVPQLASAIGTGLDLAFAGFTLPVVVVGPSAPASSTGVGVGKIV